MKTQRNWIKVTVFAVLGLTSLLSVAMTAPYQERRSFLSEPFVGDVCGKTSISRFEQYQAAIEWAEQGGTEVPFALTVSCVENDVGVTASYADLGGDSWARFEQYMAAIEGSELNMRAAPVRAVKAGPNAFEQYQAAIEWAERGGKVPQALTVSGGEYSLNSVTPFADPGGDSWTRFEQYMAAIGR